MRQVFFHIQDIANDLITACNGVSLPIPINAADAAYQNLGNYYVTKNTDGDLTLCANADYGQGTTLTMQDIQSNTYDIKGCDFVGGRPPVTR